MQIYDVSLTTVYLSVWGVIDVVNKTDLLAYHFPSHDEQRRISRAFSRKCKAGFDMVIGAIDGLLIWTLMPPLSMCRFLNIGQSNFRCHRKDKFGFNMQAICDHNLKFYWVEVWWPGATSDYMAWATSWLCHALENNGVTKLLANGMTLVGDNAYVKKMYMAIPLRGQQSGWKDGYNFSISQIRITIERAFGVFVHRWSILRAPLTIPILKVPALVETLVRLHNFCIDESEMNDESMQDEDFTNVYQTVMLSRRLNQSSNSSIVQLDFLDRPSDLLMNCSNHFADAESFRLERSIREVETPMDRMLAMAERNDVRRNLY
jgi:hypothetical protein